MQDYIPTDREYVELKSLLADGYKYIAKDMDSDTHVFTSNPMMDDRDGKYLNVYNMASLPKVNRLMEPYMACGEKLKIDMLIGNYNRNRYNIAMSDVIKAIRLLNTDNSKLIDKIEKYDLDDDCVEYDQIKNNNAMLTMLCDLYAGNTPYSWTGYMPIVREVINEHTTD